MHPSLERSKIKICGVWTSESLVAEVLESDAAAALVIDDVVVVIAADLGVHGIFRISICRICSVRTSLVVVLTCQC
jgi:hypothetical protein